MNHDRVSELYLGELSSSDRSQQVCRDRIHWLVEQARGRVIDIGASQGIVSILMGRAGLDVVGVEVEEPAISYAKTALSSEPAEVQQRVRFVHADIYGVELADMRFDTVVLGEILEHHATPRALWLRASQLVVPGGQLIGTTPFGLHPHPDHKVTFYLRELVDTIAGVGTLTHLDVRDGFIRFVVCTDPHAVPADTSDAALLARSEQTFLTIQLEAEAAYRDRREKLLEKAEQLAALKASNRKLTSSLADATAQLSSARSQVVDLGNELAGIRRKLRDAERFTLPAPEASPVSRGFSAFFGSLQREINTGGIQAAPLEALRKTYARVRRAVRGQLGAGE